MHIKYLQSIICRCLWPVARNLAITLGLMLSFLGCSLQSTSAVPLASASIRVVDSSVIYMFDDNDQPVEQPDAFIQQGAVYSDTDLLLGYIDPNSNNILDADSNIVGYISASSGDTP